MGGKMHNILELTINQLEPHMMGLLRGSIPDIATALLHNNVAVIRLPITIKKVNGELKATVGVKIQLDSIVSLHVATADEEMENHIDGMQDAQSL